MSWFRSTAIDARIRSSVIVTLHNGESFSGVLWEADDRAWVLRNPVAIAAGQREADVVLDGELVIPSENVAYAQLP